MLENEQSRYNEDGSYANVVIATDTCNKVQ